MEHQHQWDMEDTHIKGLTEERAQLIQQTTKRNEYYYLVVMLFLTANVEHKTSNNSRCEVPSPIVDLMRSKKYTNSESVVMEDRHEIARR